MRKMNGDATEVKGHCPKCGPDRYARVAGSYNHRDSESDYWLFSEYRILICLGCRSPYFQIEEFFSENIEQTTRLYGSVFNYNPPRYYYYPIPQLREKPPWWVEIFTIDMTLENLFSDVYRCMDNGLHIPAAISARTAFDRATELIGIEANLPFEKKLSALVDTGKISLDERDILEILVDAGSAAAHRGWKPDDKNLNVLVSILESFLHRTFILGQSAKFLRLSVPSRPRRPKRDQNQ